MPRAPCKEVVVVVVLLLSHLLPPSQGPQPLLWYTIVLYCTLVYNTVGEPDSPPQPPPTPLANWDSTEDYFSHSDVVPHIRNSHVQTIRVLRPCCGSSATLQCNGPPLPKMLFHPGMNNCTIPFQGIRGHQFHFLPQEECLSPGHQNWPDSRGKRNKWLLFAFQPGQTDSKIAVPLRVPSCPRPLTSHDLSLLEPALSWTQFHIFIS